MGTRRSGRGRNVVSEETVQRAVRMLAEGRSKAATATALGISSRTVFRIARGSHVRQVAARQLVRCTGCGAKPTFLPCKTCEIRNGLSEQRMPTAARPRSNVP